MRNNRMVEEKSNKQIVSGSLISYCTIGLNVLLGLIYTPWILKEIGSSQYGLYTLANSLISLFLMDFGMSAAVTRFVAAYRAKDDKSGINQVFSIVVKLYFGIMAIVAVILLIVYLNLDTIYANLEPDELATFKGVFVITAFCVVVCFPVNICNGVLNAFEEYVALKLSDVVNRVGTVAFTVIALRLGGGIYALIIVSGVFNILTLLVKILIMSKKTGIRFLPTYFDGEKLGEIATFSAWSTVSSVAQQMIFNIMPTILAMTLNTMAITMYGFANVIEGYVSTITGAINGLFLPKISRVVANSDDASEVLPLMVRVGRINQSIIMLLFIGIVLTGKEFIGLWLGEQYSDVYYCMVILTLPYCISSSLQIANSSVIALNKIKYTAIINILTGLFNLCAAYLMAPRFGVIGVCSCISATYLLRSLANQVIYIKVLKIDLKRFYLDCHFKMLPGLTFAITTSYAIVRYLFDGLVNVYGWSVFLAKAICVAIIYAFMMWLIGWNDFEKSLIKSFLPIKGRKL